MATPSSKRIYLFDTTLRDGAQTQGVDFSVADKMAIARALDDLGVDYIEGGWPGANPTDDDFFSKNPNFKNAQFVAFGMTHRHGISADNDQGLAGLANSAADSSCIVGKSWDEQVKTTLKISLDDNLQLIQNSVKHLKDKLGGESMFDAEHFFDGYKANSDYALKCLDAALQGGARWVVLCDTRGGTLPHEVFEIAQKACEKFGGDNVGIHAHNDTENAVANSLAAVQAGVRQVQGTINGLGERCGNANMMSLIPNLTIKMGYDTGVSKDNMKKLVAVSRLLDERLGLEPVRQRPYVGTSAFAHKGGLHVSAIAKDPKTYEHIKPEEVGNDRIIVMSDQAGMTNVLMHLKNLGLDDIPKDELHGFLALVKEREFEGYSYDGADASFELLLHTHMKTLPNFFDIMRFRVINERRINALGELINESEATVQVQVKGKDIMRVAMGIGPVHAFDSALREALIEAFPPLQDIELIDYKVRIMPPHDSERGTAAITRVLLESADGNGNRWTTVGVSGNVIDASALALYDSYAYRLYKENAKA